MFKLQITFKSKNSVNIHTRYVKANTRKEAINILSNEYSHYNIVNIS